MSTNLATIVRLRQQTPEQTSFAMTGPQVQRWNKSWGAKKGLFNWLPITDSIVGPMKRCESASQCQTQRSMKESFGQTLHSKSHHSSSQTCSRIAQQQHPTSPFGQFFITFITRRVFYIYDRLTTSWADVGMGRFTSDQIKFVASATRLMADKKQANDDIQQSRKKCQKFIHRLRTCNR